MHNTVESIDAMLGETLVEVVGMEAGSEEITFHTASGRTFRMYHSQDCCESVYLDDVTGDPADLLNTRLLKSEEVSSDEWYITEQVAMQLEGREQSYESHTWTFYHLATLKGYVTLRWLGVSNGYYSEGVDFCEV